MSSRLVGWMVVATLVPAFVIGLPGVTGARGTNVDIRGTWPMECVVGTDRFPQTLRILTQDAVSGAVEGDDVGGGMTFTVTGTVTGDSVVLEIVLVGGSYVSDHEMLVSGSGVNLSMVGPFSDSNGSAGSCEANRSDAPEAAISILPTTPANTTPAARKSAVTVGCNRDTSVTTVAHFRCTAVVADAGVPAQSRQPTGSVRWTSTVGTFTSGATCTLAVPDVGSPKCTVVYEAPPEAAPIGTALPVTASYGGDDVFAASSSSHKLGPGLAAQAPPPSVAGTDRATSVPASDRESRFPVLPVAGGVAVVVGALALAAAGRFPGVRGPASPGRGRGWRRRGRRWWGGVRARGPPRPHGPGRAG